MLADINSFTLGWNQGRGGFLFALIFLSIEYADVGRELTFNLTKRFRILFGILLTLVLSYFTGVVFLGFHQILWDLGRSLGVPLLFSWVWIWDYMVIAIYLSAILVIFFGIVGLRIMPSGVIYLAGMIAILTLDALFPYSTLGPLQAVVPIILFFDIQMLSLIGVTKVVTEGNLLTINGAHGPFTLAVFWPSAGVHSMIIYSLIMAALLLKIQMPARRRIGYFIAGAVGTFFVNVIRIFSLSAYVALVTTDPARFEEFHAVAGEIMFLPWVAVYVILVTWIESRKQGRLVLTLPRIEQKLLRQ